MLIVISLISLFSIFATPGVSAIIFGNDQSEKREERENIPCRSIRVPRLISLNSLFSYFARYCPLLEKPPKILLPVPCFTTVLLLLYPALSPNGKLGK